MAGVLSRRAATAVLSRRAATAFAPTIRPSSPTVAPTIRATVPASGSARQYAAVATPRLPAASATTRTTLRLSSATPIVKRPIRKLAALATPRLPAAAATITTTTLRLSSAAATTTTTTALRLSSATATMKGAIRFAAPLRRNHTSALPEALEARIQELQAHLDNKMLKLRDELQKGTVEAFEKVEKGVLESNRKLEKAHLQDYDSYLLGKSIQDERITTLSELCLAEGRRSLEWATKSSEENAKVVHLAGKTSLKVVTMVVGTAATTGFVTARMESRSKQAAEEDALKAFNERIEDAIKGLDITIERAVEVALTKQGLEKKKEVVSGVGGGPSST